MCLHFSFSNQTFGITVVFLWRLGWLVKCLLTHFQILELSNNNRHHLYCLLSKENSKVFTLKFIYNNTWLLTPVIDAKIACPLWSRSPPGVIKFFPYFESKGIGKNSINFHLSISFKNILVYRPSYRQNRAKCKYTWSNSSKEEVIKAMVKLTYPRSKSHDLISFAGESKPSYRLFELSSLHQVPLDHGYYTIIMLNVLVSCFVFLCTCNIVQLTFCFVFLNYHG